VTIPCLALPCHTISYHTPFACLLLSINRTVLFICLCFICDVEPTPHTEFSGGEERRAAQLVEHEFANDYTVSNQFSSLLSSALILWYLAESMKPGGVSPDSPASPFNHVNHVNDRAGRDNVLERDSFKDSVEGVSSST
jgi:hypothetical protein